MFFFLKKNHRKVFISENSEVWCCCCFFSNRLDGFLKSPELQFEKNALKSLIFFEKLIFAFLSPEL